MDEKRFVKDLRNFKSQYNISYNNLIDIISRKIDDNYVRDKPKISGKSKTLIPTEIFQNGNLSILESVVKCLKESSDLSLSEIALILKRDPRNIWKVYNNSIKKNEKK